MRTTLPVAQLYLPAGPLQRLGGERRPVGRGQQLPGGRVLGPVRSLRGMVSMRLKASSTSTTSQLRFLRTAPTSSTACSIARMLVRWTITHVEVQPRRGLRHPTQASPIAGSTSRTPGPSEMRLPSLAERQLLAASAATRSSTLRVDMPRALKSPSLSRTALGGAGGSTAPSCRGAGWDSSTRHRRSWWPPVGQDAPRLRRVGVGTLGNGQRRAVRSPRPR